MDGLTSNIIYGPGVVGEAGGSVQFDATTTTVISLPSNNKLDVQYSFTILLDIWIGEYFELAIHSQNSI